MLKSNVILFILTILILTGCKTTQSLKVGKVTNIPDVKLRGLLRDNELQFDKLYLKKVNFTFDNGKEKKSFKGSFVIKKDSVIIVSIYAPMGIELIRTQLSKHEVTIIDKHNKVVMSTDYGYFNRNFGIDVDFSMLQAILSNTLFVYPAEENYYEELKKYKHDVNSNSYSFKSLKDKRLSRISKRRANDLIIHEFDIYPEIFRIFNVFIKDFSSNQSLVIDYKNFQKFNDILFPEYINLKGERGINKVLVSIKINYIEINDGGSLHFKIPSSYTFKDI